VATEQSELDALRGRVAQLEEQLRSVQSIGHSPTPAEAALRDSEERSRLMADAIPQIVWVTDAEGRVEFFNRQWSEYTGVPFEPTTAAEVGARFVHPDDQPATAEAFDKALQNGTTFLVEHRIRSAEGHYRWFLVRAVPYRDPSTGRVVRWFGSSTDIHDRKQAAAQQEFLLTLSDAIRPLRDPDAIKASGSRVLGERLQANRTFYAEVDGDDWVVEGGYAHGVAPLPPGRYGAETYGRRIMDTFRAGRRMVFCDARSDPGFTPEEREAHIAIAILAAAGVPLVKEGKLVAILTVHSAEPRNWTEEDLLLVEDTAERTWAAVERARAETALRQSEERLTFALEAGGGVGTFDWDVPGDRLYMDARSAQLFSVDPELAATGPALADFVASIHPDDRPSVSEKVQQACETGDYAAEYRILQPDGSVRWVFARGRCHQDAAGNPTRFLGVIVDMTPQVLARKELERVNKELEEFAYVASHDLQEPLRMVNIYTQLLVRDFCSTDAKAQSYAELVRQGVSRMETLIRDLLTYSRSVQNDELPVGKADLSAALSEALSVLKNRIEENSAVIKAELLPVVRGDTAQIAHVFQNLLSNALKYRKNNTAPEIHISATVQGEHCFICVQDNGIGFDQKYAERIFGLFKRLHKEEYPGTGLGLAICQRLVERYGGRMWAEGTPGEGAKFYFSLPCAGKE
jgi:PAS domain S-box-containing protein